MIALSLMLSLPANNGILAFQLHQSPLMRIAIKDIHLKQIAADE